MNDTKEYLKPYLKLQAVEELKEQNRLLDLYVKHHQIRYKARPVFPPGTAHLTLLKDLKKMANEKAGALIEHYFKMEDPWFKTQCHSLDCLKKNLNKVNADYEQRSVKMTHNEKIRIEFLRVCSKCLKSQKWVGSPEEVDNDVCGECRNLK